MLLLNNRTTNTTGTEEWVFNGNEVIFRGSAADGAGLYAIQTRLGGVYLP